MSGGSLLLGPQEVPELAKGEPSGVSDTIKITARVVPPNVGPSGGLKALTLRTHRLVSSAEPLRLPERALECPGAGGGKCANGGWTWQGFHNARPSVHEAGFRGGLL